jgi:hypothetical protein
MTHYRSLVQTYYCDGRGDSGGICIASFETHSGTAKDAWRQAREDGWKKHGKGHLCPRHDTNPQPHDSETGQSA